MLTVCLLFSNVAWAVFSYRVFLKKKKIGLFFMKTFSANVKLKRKLEYKKSKAGEAGNQRISEHGGRS